MLYCFAALLICLGAAETVFTSSSSALFTVGGGLCVLVFWFSVWAVCCPRCGLHVFGKVGSGRLFGPRDIKRDCPKCGRDRFYVWPLQSRLRPEKH